MSADAPFGAGPLASPSRDPEPGAPGKRRAAGRPRTLAAPLGPRLQCGPVPASLARARWLPAVLFAAGVVALYAGALGTGFLNDDYLFLEDAVRGPWAAGQGALENYFRPLSRQLWFGVLAPLLGPNPLAFHLTNLALFLGAAALLYDLLRAFAPRAGALAGLVYFAVLPLQRVNLTWISCCQDLLALVASLGALALFRRGRDRLALAAFLAAALAKESALPLPALLFLWSWRVEGRAPAAALRRVAPFALPIAAWAAGELALRASAPAPAVLRFGPLEFLAAWVHLPQALAGLENPTGLLAAFWSAAPSLAALAAFGALALWFPAGGASRAAAHGGAEAPAHARHAHAFAFAWLAAFAVPVAPVVHGWSAYFYTLAAVGGAVLVAVHAARLSRLAFAAAVAAALWWHAAASAAPAFAVADDAWGWTSHLTAHYFERGAALSARLREALLRVAPEPERGTRFYFATLPPFAGFQMGNGAAIRAAYGDRSLESHFYSGFSDSTAAGHPCVFLFWDGLDFQRLYANARDPFFQVGADLLLLDRPAGAVHAFARAHDAGELGEDVWYWSGWALLWSGRRAAAEAAWTAFGAADDTTMYRAWMRAAVTALAESDTTAARRALFGALRAGVGRPEVHAALAEMLRGRSPKFALLETKVLAFLVPHDFDVRLALLEGLLEARLDDVARREVAALEESRPDRAGDPALAAIRATLAGRAPAAGGIAVLPGRR